MYVCEISGKVTSYGNSLAILKRKAQLGRRKITGITRRKFRPNLQYYKVFCSKLNRLLRIRICTKVIKQIKSCGIEGTLSKRCYTRTVNPRLRRLFK